jgi:hypothetical protein
MVTRRKFEFQGQQVELEMLAKYPAAKYEIRIDGEVIGSTERQADGTYLASAGKIVAAGEARRYSVTRLILKLNAAHEGMSSSRGAGVAAYPWNGAVRRPATRFCQCEAMLRLAWNVRCGAHGRYLENGKFYCGAHRPSKLVVSLQDNHDRVLDDLRDHVRPDGLLQQTGHTQFAIAGNGIEIAVPGGAA